LNIPTSPPHEIPTPDPSLAREGRGRAKQRKKTWLRSRPHQ
jgi:hypothetical protein